MTPRLLLVLPTRNRADLAARAVRSVVAEGVAEVRLLVSDNSTDEEQTLALAALAAGEGVEVMRPPSPLPMGDHWEWATTEALRRAPEATHLMVLTDRMVWKHGGLRRLVGLLADEPEAIWSFLCDLVRDDQDPLRVHLVPWSGQIRELPSRELLAGAARGALRVALPRLLNCAAPVTVLRAVRARFGVLCAGQSPDYAFAFRALAVVPSLRHLEEALLINFGQARSNGMTIGNGLYSKEAEEYRRLLPDAQVFPASPVPGLFTPLSGVLHEYELVRRAARELPAVDREAALEALAIGVRRLRRAELREDGLRRIEAAGWTWRPEGWRARAERNVRDAQVFRAAAAGARGLVRRACAALRARTGVALLDARQFVFDDLEDALRGVEEWPRRPGVPR